MRASVLATFFLACVASAQTNNNADLFESKVRPLFVSRCSSCHGDQVQMGGLRLTSKDSVHAAGVIVPGDPGASRLMQAVRQTGKIKMPPNGKLEDREVAALERWIAQGAVWPETATTQSATPSQKWWAFQPVKKASPPEVKDTAWPRSDVDRFILRKLEEKSLHPVAD